MQWRRWKSAPALFLMLALASCIRVLPPPAAISDASASLAEVTLRPWLVDRQLGCEDAGAADSSFVESRLTLFVARRMKR